MYILDVFQTDKQRRLYIMDKNFVQHIKLACLVFLDFQTRDSLRLPVFIRAINWKQDRSEIYQNIPSALSKLLLTMC